MLSNSMFMFYSKMNQEKKYQVFISSTYTDLIEARNAAINTVLESYNFPVGMEMFGADNDEQWTIIKELIDSSDFYILIMGHRYGSISKKDGISFTEKEFDYALEKGVKLMCFVRKDHVATLPNERDEDPAIKEKISQFRTKVTTDRTCEFWDSVNDLKHKISNSLYKNMRKHGGIGWVRGNQISGQLAEEIARLSEENRMLREENSYLKELANNKIPLLSLLLSGSENMDLIRLKRYRLKDSEYYRKPEKKEIKSDGNGFLGIQNNLSSINEYNEKIDNITEEIVNNHNSALEVIQNIQHECISFSLDIVNNGNTVANAISIEIEASDNIAFIDNNSKNNLRLYRSNYKKNLIKDIEEKWFYQIHYLNENSSCEIYNEIKVDLPYSIEQENDVEIRILEFNKVVVDKIKLLHSRSFNLYNLYLYPKYVGQGVIKINLICAELTEPVVYEIPYEIVE